ncbi:hypothetical protein [Pantoea sp. X85]|uniref:hypothetical protein n=1 Tax=Pantoea sp. X85 TaxID=3037258 RepID=UPI002413422D|nr:hypothetical protein [Pantoea sp. X85]WFL67415.1 hypothetical protein P6287_19105 [Pantoea sp. X85]
MPLPSHTYFTLKQAAKRADCDINDLLHFAANGSLQLCIKIPEYGFHSDGENEVGEPTWTSIDFDTESRFRAPNNNEEGIEHIFAKYESDYFYIEEGFDIPTEKKHTMIIKGFLAISRWDVYREEETLTDESLQMGYFSEFQAPRVGDSDITPGYAFQSIVLHDLLSFSIDKIFILKDEFDLLIKGGSQVDSYDRKTSTKLINDGARESKSKERHAVNREDLFKSAIFILSKYPDECRGIKKEISPEKWRDCIFSHLNEIPPLQINNEQVILKHLRSAVNGKGVE